MQQAQDRGDEEQVERGGEQERRGEVAVEERRQQPADEGPQRQRATLGGGLLGQAGGHVGCRVELVDGVDVPGFDRAGVQRAADRQQQDAGEEAGERVGAGENEAGQQVQQRAGDHDRPPAEDVGEPAGR